MTDNPIDSTSTSPEASMPGRTIHANNDYVEHVEGAFYQGGTHYHNNKAPSPDDLAAMKNAYLNRLLKDVSQVVLSGIDPQAAGQEVDACLELSAIYTALLTISAEQQEQQPPTEIDLVREQQHVRRLSALAQLDRYQRLVLLGDPGSGKSTFVNFVAMCLAGELVQHRIVDLALLTAPLPNDQGEDGQEQQPWTHRALLPIRVILRDFAAKGLPSVGQRATADHLWAFLAQDLLTPFGDYAPYLQKQLALPVGGLLLLDGLDEVPEADQRRTQIKQAIEDFAAVFPHCRILVTSRTYAYQKQDWRLQGFSETVLAPFTEGQIRRFVDRWYHHIAGRRGIPIDEAKGRAERLKQKIFKRPALAELAQRPLLLALMASLYAWRGCELPEKRVELYRATVDLLLDCWEQGKRVLNEDGTIILQQPSLSEFLNVGKERVLSALQVLAFHAHTSQAELTGTANIRQEDLVNGLMQISQKDDVKPRQLEKYLWDRAGVLIPHGVGVYTFPHRTFQEYLAACYLTAQQEYPDNVAVLVRKDPNRWREVLLLAAASVANAAPMIWVLAETLCEHDLCNAYITSSDVWGALLAGQALAETANLTQISPRNQPKAKRVCAWLTAILTEQIPRDTPFPSVERALAGNILAQLGDPRPGVNVRADGLPDLVWCDVPAGKFTMGEGKQRHSVTLSAYQISPSPVTNVQYRAFIKDGGYTQQAYWADGGWAWKEQAHITEPQWAGGDFDLANHPVVRVSWYEATAFCTWLTHRLRDVGELSRQQAIRLPTEAEWEKAARGTDACEYPWGNEKIMPELANYDETGLGTTSTVGCFPRGASPYMCEDMAGNVWEWCQDNCDRDKSYNIITDTYKEGIVDPVSKKGSRRVIRGGSWGRAAGHCRAAYRDLGAPDDRGRDVGFRLVRTPA